MKALVIGLGSMGKRRIRLMKQIDDNLEIIGVDSRIDRREEADNLFNIKTFSDMDEALLCFPDCAFVCTSPLSHGKIISDLLKKNIHIFTEINLVDDYYDEILKTIKNDDHIIFLSSTFLFRKDINWIINRISNQMVNYIYHTGQYLPDWHPWENIKDFFVSDKRTNGCREIMAIELPWMFEAFGDISDIKTIKSNISDLKLDYPDNYFLMIEHKNGNKGLVAVDVVARKAQRNLEIYNDNLHIFWNGTPDSLKEFDVLNGQEKNISTYATVDNDSKYSENIIENAYKDEIVSFFDVIAGNDIQRYGFDKDKIILNWIDKIENGDK